MKILVTGASGFVGRHLAARLARDGHEVVALRRGSDGGDGGFAGPQDLAAIDRFPAWPADVDAVAHLAALNPSRGDPASRDLAALRRANVEATAALARRARREGVPRMVFLSSSSVHAPGAEPMAETVVPAPRSPYAVSKAEAETAFWDALREGGTAGCVVRPVPVFGPGARNLTTALARLARSPFPLPLNGLGTPRSLVSVDGLAEAIALCLGSDGATGKTFLVADEEPLTPAGIVAALREGLGRPPAILPAPAGLAGLAARALGKDEPWRAATAGLVVDNRRIRRMLGWEPANAREALRAMAASGRL